MNVLLSDRCISIFRTIYENELTPIDFLTETFHVSDRTVRNDIVVINDYLAKFQSEILLQRNKGYFIENKEVLRPIYDSLIRNSQTNVSTETLENRIFLTTVFLLNANTYVSMDDLCAYIYVSSSTMVTYLNTIKKQMQPFYIKIVSKSNLGYKIVGTEQDIRSYIFEVLVSKNHPDYVASFTDFESTLFNEVNLPDLYDIVLFFFPPTQYKFNDYYRKNMVIKTAIMIKRIIEGHTISIEENEYSYDYANSIVINMITELEDLYQIIIDDANIRWLVSQIFLELISQSSVQSIYSTEKFEQIVNALIQQISFNFGLDLSEDFVLQDDLIKHLTSYLPKKENKKNPLLGVIKKKYAYAFEICLSTIKDLNLLKTYDLNEDDIGYIAIHIAASIERQNKNQSSRIRTAIICGQGFSTSRLLEAIIMKKFEKQIKIIKIMSYAEFKAQPLDGIDLIISTIPLKNHSITIAHFDFLKLTNSITHIQTIIHNYQQKQTYLNDLFSEKSFLILNKPMEKKEALIRLLKTTEYENEKQTAIIEKIEQREALYPTDISQYIAIPHIIDQMIHQSKILVLINSSSIKWQENNHVSILFLMLVSPSDKHKLQLFMEWVSDIIDDDQRQRNLLELKHFSQFLEFVATPSPMEN